MPFVIQNNRIKLNKFLFLIILIYLISVIINDDNDTINNVQHHATMSNGRSMDSLPSSYTNGSSSPGPLQSLEPDISPDEQEEKARLISQVLELQNTLDGI